MQEKKQSSKLQQIRYRKLAMNNGNTIVTYNSASKVQPKGIFIQFPLMENQDKSSIPVIDPKLYEEDAYRKNNFRAVKALMKVYEEGRRKDSTDGMNMLGLDIKKIPYIANKGRNDESFTRIQKMKFKSRNASPLVYKQKESARSNLLRNTTESSDTESKPKFHKQEDDKITKLEMTESAYLYRNKKSVKDRQSPSPSKKGRKKYLYQQLAGKQHSLREEVNLVYEKRIKSYTQLLWKLQLSHNIYINLDLKPEQLNNKGRRYKAYVGPGNNSAMIKGLLKRRYWWGLSDDKSECSFIWSQIKIKTIFEKQKKSQSKKPRLKKDIVDREEEYRKTDSVKRSNSIQANKKMLPGMNELFNFKVLNQEDINMYKRYMGKYQKDKQRPYQFRQQHQDKQLEVQLCENNLIHNHLQNNFYLGNKKALFYNLKEYYELIGDNAFEYIPLTFHIKKGFKDPEYKRFVAYYNRRKTIIKQQQREEEEGYATKRKTRNIWIVKPGENTNQGRGITVIDEIYQLNAILKRTSKQKCPSESPPKKKQNSQSIKDVPDEVEEHDPQNKRTFIVQMYLDRPFLYQNRKFDLRHYMLITNMYGVMRAYWYLDGYVRTSSYEFNIDNFDPQIHLTNDAIQKKYSDYSRYEPYNKISYQEFQRYLDSAHGTKKYNFKKNILSKMKEMGTDAAKSVFTKISPKNQCHNFEIFGLDFMIDKNFRPWLIEINTNPCLDCSCPLLDRIIPYMVEQSLKLSIDVAYPPPNHYPNTSKHYAPMISLESFKYELIFDSQIQGQAINKIYKKGKKNLIEQIGDISDDEQFKDDGKQIKLDDFT